MKEKPVIFSSEMVRAILDGRKTQTRRICKFEATDSWGIECLVQNGVYFCLMDRADIPSQRVDCPYGQVGDRLWVKETQWRNGGWVADGPSPLRNDSKIPSIFMKKIYARIWLEITSIRVERVQDISETDAIEEGVECRCDVGRSEFDQCFLTFREHFAMLWDSLNAKRGYGLDKNPWVWVIEFKKL